MPMSTLASSVMLYRLLCRQKWFTFTIINTVLSEFFIPALLNDLHYSVLIQNENEGHTKYFSFVAFKSNLKLSFSHMNNLQKMVLFQFLHASAYESLPYCSPLNIPSGWWTLKQWGTVCSICSFKTAFLSTRKQCLWIFSSHSLSYIVTALRFLHKYHDCT